MHLAGIFMNMLVKLQCQPLRKLLSNRCVGPSNLDGTVGSKVRKNIDKSLYCDKTQSELAGRAYRSALAPHFDLDIFNLLQSNRYQISSLLYSDDELFYSIETFLSSNIHFLKIFGVRINKIKRNKLKQNNGNEFFLFGAEQLGNRSNHLENEG